MRTLHYAPVEFGTILWDENKKIVAALHENDCDFRDEYLSPIFEHFGIKVQESSLPKFITKKILRQHGLIE
jgi:hypothetical protein